MDIALAVNPDIQDQARRDEMGGNIQEVRQGLEVRYLMTSLAV
jgi:hypothetical protein